MKFIATSILFPVLALLAAKPSAAQEEDHSTLRGLKAPPYLVVFDRTLEHPGVYYGSSGNADGHWVIGTSAFNNGKRVRVALRAKLAYVGNIEPNSGKPFEYNSDTGMYTNKGRPRWNFDFEVDSDVECLASSTSCTPLATYSYEMAVDSDPTINTKWKKSDPINTAPHDHEFGKSDTERATKKIATSEADYFATIRGGTYHVAQQSWNYGFSEVIGGGFANNGPLIDQEGIYDITFSINDKKSKKMLAKASIRVLVSDPAKCTPDGSGGKRQCFPDVASDCNAANIGKFNMFFTSKQTKECLGFIAGIKQ